MWSKERPVPSQPTRTQRGRERRQSREAQRTEDLPEQGAEKEDLTEEACCRSPKEGEKH